MANSTPNASLLVLVDVKWTSWRGRIHIPGTADPWCQHEQFLRSLLCAQPEDGQEANFDAWILHDPAIRETERLIGTTNGDEAAAAKQILTMVRESGRAAPETAPGPGAQRWGTGTAAKETLELLKVGLKECDEQFDRLVIESPGLVTGLLNLFACRIYLDRSQLHRLAGGPVTPLEVEAGACACIDFRFQFHSGSYWLYAYLSVWSSEPASPAHTPFPVTIQSSGPRNLRPSVNLETERNRFVKDLSEPFSRRLYQAFPPVDITVSGWEHRPPRFWVVAGRGAKQAFDVAAERRPLDAFSRMLLGATSTSTGLAEGMLATSSGRARVLRRFLPGEDAPGILIIPDPNLSLRDQEDAVRALVYGISDIETEVAAELFDLTVDLEIDDTLIALYASVGHRASVLWDQLAMFLLDAKGTKDLDRIHRQIQLIHLMLLQGIADLDLVQSQTQYATAKVAEQAHEVGDRFDSEFTEDSPGVVTSIREGLRTSGYLANAERASARTFATAQRVRAGYQSLIEAIGDAFDDRRVRHTDRIGHLALFVAIGLAGIGLVTEAFGNVLEKLPSVWSGVTLASFLMVFVPIGFMATRKWFKNIGGVTTADFSPTYKQLRKYLSNCRTDRLERIREEQIVEVRRKLAEPRVNVRSVWNEYYDNWDRYDRELTEELACFLDGLERKSLEPDLPDLDELQRGIERWARIGMLISERPRSFSKFPLPRLMLMYRLYPIIRNELKARGVIDQKLVADSDLFVGLRLHCTARYDEIATLTEWGRRWELSHNGDALLASDLIAEMAQTLRIRAGMSRESWQAAVQMMRNASPHPERRSDAARQGKPPAKLR
jgi:hypothetical protein